jgi:two-component system nitrate/nitrite response regulator NarL
MLHGRQLDLDDGAAGLRIVIVSDIRLYRDGLAHVLSLLDDVADVATCETAIECLAHAHRSAPDIILLDMSTTSSDSAARLFSRELRSARIVALAVPESEPRILACVEAGVTGYVAREGSVDDLISAIRHAARGEALCTPVIAGGLMRRLAAGAHDKSLAAHLTARELEIAEHIALGMSNRVIANRLGIELCTVKNHVHNILEKLGVGRRADVVGYIRN